MQMQVDLEETWYLRVFEMAYNESELNSIIGHPNFLTIRLNVRHVNFWFEKPSIFFYHFQFINFEYRLIITHIAQKYLENIVRLPKYFESYHEYC